MPSFAESVNSHWLLDKMQSRPCGVASNLEVHRSSAKVKSSLLKMSVYINTDSVIHFSLPKSNSCLFAATLPLKQFYHKRISSILCKEKHNSNEFSALLSEFWVLLFCWWHCGSILFFFLTFPVLVTCISNWSVYGSTYGYLFTVPAGQTQANSLAKITKTTRSPLALL